MYCREHEAAEIIASIEGNPLFSVLVARMVAAPYRQWAGSASDVEQLMDGPDVLTKICRQAARMAIGRFVSIRVEWGPEHEAARAVLVNALAAKMAESAMVVIEAKAA
jgi:hypothetical protein